MMALSLKRILVYELVTEILRIPSLVQKNIEEEEPEP